MCRIFLASIFSFILSCQAPIASEDSTVTSNTIPSAEEIKESAYDLTSGKEAVQQQVQRIRDLQTQLQIHLDSLYTRENSTELRSRTDSLESAYFSLADTEARWEKFRVKNSVYFDSLGNASNDAAMTEFHIALDSLSKQLQSSIQHSEKLIFQE